MEDKVIEKICEAIKHKYLLELQDEEGDDPFHFAPYIFYTFKDNYGLFGTKRVYHEAGRLEVEAADLVIEIFNNIEETDLQYEKSFFLENFPLLGKEELNIICANKDYRSHHKT